MSNKSRLTKLEKQIKPRGEEKEVILILDGTCFLDPEGNEIPDKDFRDYEEKYGREKITFGDSFNDDAERERFVKAWIEKFGYAPSSTPSDKLAIVEVLDCDVQRWRETGIIEKVKC